MKISELVTLWCMKDSIESSDILFNDVTRIKLKPELRWRRPFTPHAVILCRMDGKGHASKLITADILHSNGNMFIKNATLTQLADWTT